MIFEPLNFFKRSLMSIAVLLLISMTLVSNIQASGPWKLSKEEDDIQVYLRNTPNSPLKSFRGEVIINSDISLIIAKIEDPSSYPQWLHNCRSAKTIKIINSNQSVNYIVTNMPWPVADRDAVLIGTRSSFGQSVQITLESKPDMVSPVDGKVRIEKISGNWTLTPEGEDKVKVSYEMNIDPGGDIPKWIVNSMTVDLPFHTLSKLRALVE